MTISLDDARRSLQAQLEDGTTCPCCEQHAQRYRWTLPGSAIKVMLRMYSQGGTEEFIESKTVKKPGQGGLHSICAMWRLVEEESVRRPDGGKSGWWRVTWEGEEFIWGGRIPKYAFIYASQTLWYDGPLVTISDRLREPFNWRDHMGGYE